MYNQLITNYNKLVNDVVKAIWNSKLSLHQIITRYYKEQKYYNKEQQLENFKRSLLFNLKTDCSSEEMDEEVLLEITGEVLIKKEDVIQFIEECDFYCWDKYLDPNSIIDKNYFALKIERFYFSLQPLECFFM